MNVLSRKTCLKLSHFLPWGLTNELWWAKPCTCLTECHGTKHEWAVWKKGETYEVEGEGFVKFEPDPFIAVPVFTLDDLLTRANIWTLVERLFIADRTDDKDIKDDPVMTVGRFFSESRLVDWETFEKAVETILSLDSPDPKKARIAAELFRIRRKALPAPKETKDEENIQG